MTTHTSDVADLPEALTEYLEAQDALDNREYAGINAEPYEKLVRSRNHARAALESALAAGQDTAAQAVAEPADTVVLNAAMRAIQQAIELIGTPTDERMRAVRRVLRGAVIVAEDDGKVAPQPSPKAQEADSVQEDAARWHWMAEYIVGTRTDLDDDLIASATVDELRKLVDADLAARKQGEKQ